MKILHILDHSVPLHSGYAYRTKSILEHQHELGFETDQVTSAKHPYGDIAEETVNGLHFHRIKAPDNLLARGPIMRQVAIITSLRDRLDHVIQDFRPDVLHAHSPCLTGIAALQAGKRFDIPVVYELRALWEDAAVDHGTASHGNLRYRASRALETYVLRRADAITTICSGLREEIEARRVPRERLTIIPNGVEIERFPVSSGKNADLVESLGLDGKFVAGFIGSFYHYEGLHLLLEAVARLSKSDDRLRLLLVGDGTAAPALRQQISDLQLQDTVILTGSVPHEEVDKYYDLMDICIYPRLSIRLTELVTPLKPLEAMAKGKVVVASDVGGHKELISHGDTGFLFRANDVASLADTIETAAKNLKSGSDIQSAARRFVEQERSWRGIVARYKKVYNDVSGVPG